MRKTILAVLLLTAGASAQVYGGRGNPQYDPRYDNRGYDRDSSREGGYREGGYGNYQGQGGDPLDRVSLDLERAASGMGYLSRGEWRRINHARDEIREFQEKSRRGRFDRGELNDVISGLQHIVDRNRLDPRDRGMLENDLEQLREFRAANSGYRGRPDARYGYDRYGNDRYEPGYDQYGNRR